MVRTSTPHQFILIVVTLSLLAALVAACGGAQPAPPAAPAAQSGSAAQPAAQAATGGQPLQGCTVLTKADAEAVLGGAVDEPKQKEQEGKNGAWTSTCSYYSSGNSRGAGLLLTYTPKSDPAKALTAYVDSLKKTLGDAYKPDTVAGAGDGAVWDASMKQLTVFKGAYMLVLTMSGGKLDADAALEGAKILAGKVLANLPQ